MNINDGQLYGLGSSPGYDPSIFAKPRVPPAIYKALTDEDLGAPLFDRATNGFYPAGSTSSRSPRWRRSTRASST